MAGREKHKKRSSRSYRNNMGQFAGWLRMKVDNFAPYQFNEVKGQPFMVADLVKSFTEIYNK